MKGPSIACITPSDGPDVGLITTLSGPDILYIPMLDGQSSVVFPFREVGRVRLSGMSQQPQVPDNRTLGWGCSERVMNID